MKLKLQKVLSKRQKFQSFRGTYDEMLINKITVIF